MSDILSKDSDIKKGDILLKIENTNINSLQQLLDYIKSNCPRSDSGTNHLADSFILTTVGSGVNKTIYIANYNCFYLYIILVLLN